MYYHRRYIFIFQSLNLLRAKGFEAYFIRTFAQRSIFVSILKIKGFGFLKEQKEKIVLYRAISIAGPSIVCSFGPISIVCSLGSKSLLFVHWVKYLLFVSWFNLYCLFHWFKSLLFVHWVKSLLFVHWVKSLLFVQWVNFQMLDRSKK